MKPDPFTLAMLGFTPGAIANLRSLQSAEREERLRALKLEARRLYRKKAAEIHPDRHEDDPDKTAELAKLNVAFQAIKEVTPEAFAPPPPPQQHVRFVRFVHVGDQGYSTTTASTTIGGGPGYIRITVL